MLPSGEDGAITAQNPNSKKANQDAAGKKAKKNQDDTTSVKTTQMKLKKIQGPKRYQNQSGLRTAPKINHFDVNGYDRQGPAVYNTPKLDVRRINNRNQEPQ